jgi:ATP-binding cassette subfamily B protein
MTAYRFLLPYLRQGILPLSIGIFLLLLVDFFQLLIPRYIKGAVDALTGGRALPGTLLKTVALIIGTAFLIFGLRMIWRRLIFGQARRIEEALRNRIFGHLLTLSQSFFYRTPIGDIMARATNDMEAVRMALGMGLVSLVDSLILGSAAIGFMLYINVKLTLVSLLPMPLVAFLTQRFSHLLHQRFEQVQGTFSEIMEKVRESLVGITVVKAYTLQEREEAKLARLSQTYLNQNLSLARITGTLFPLSALMTSLSLAIVLWLGGRQVLSKEITAGDFVAFISYLGLLSWPMMALGWVINLMKRGAVSLGRIESILNEVPEIADRPGVEPIVLRENSFRGEGLNYAYPGTGMPVLTEVSFQFISGKQVLITGRTGCGKTTLALLMARILESPPETLFLSGHEIHTIPLSQLRKTVSLVPQEPFLFSDTIRGNLLFAGPGATEAELWAALQKASFESEVRGFDQGLDTVVGERGVLLSGGQKQRLALARAFLNSPPILILDNTLASVDLATERTIQRVLQTQRKDLITIIISHRLVGFEGVDSIYLLEEGRVTESGTHQQLIQAEGLYARLYARQRIEMELKQGGF